MIRIKKILKWYDDQLCPKCGSKVFVDGRYGCGQWYPKSEKIPFEFCEKCDFKHYLDWDNRLPADLYIEEIRKVIMYET